MRRPLVLGLLIAIACFGIVHVVVWEKGRWPIKSWILEAGQRAGCNVISLGREVEGPDGPFYGDDLRTRLWNILYRHSGWTVPAAAGFAAAMIGYGVCAGPLGRTLVFGYRGPTRCGACGYALSGLKEMLCPECGRAV